MVCSTSCLIATVFIIGMIYFYNATSKSVIVQQYRTQLTFPQKAIYDKIAAERLSISLKGYGLGFLISLAIIYYNYQKKQFRPSATVCTVLAISFLTNYFYYILSPKTDWMLNHVEGRAQTQAWLQMYKTMQYYYHAGLVLGILGIGIFAYAFRCWNGSGFYIRFIYK